MFGETKKDAKRNEQFDKNISQFVEDMSDRSVSKGFLILSSVALIISWLFVLLFSNFAVFFYDKLGGFSSKPVFFVLFVPFLAGFVFAYSVFRLKFPDMEENKLLESDLMASLDYQNNSNKRWLLWIFSILTGLANVVLLIIVSSALNKNSLYLFDF